jgi:hypothetical protein
MRQSSFYLRTAGEKCLKCLNSETDQRVRGRRKLLGIVDPKPQRIRPVGGGDRIRTVPWRNHNDYAILSGIVPIRILDAIDRVDQFGIEMRQCAHGSVDSRYGVVRPAPSTAVVTLFPHRPELVESHVFVVDVKCTRLVFPVATGGGLLLVLAVGILFFHERLSAPGYLGIALGTAALILLALP